MSTNPYACGPVRTLFHDSTIADTLDWAESEARRGRAGQGTGYARLSGPIDPLLADLLGAATELRRSVGAALAGRVPAQAISAAAASYDAAARAHALAQEGL